MPFVVRITLAPCNIPEVKYQGPLNSFIQLRHSSKKPHRFEDQLNSLLHDIFLTVTNGLKLRWICDENLQKQYTPPRLQHRHIQTENPILKEIIERDQWNDD